MGRLDGRAPRLTARSRSVAVRARTWQMLAAAWPERAGDPFAALMNAIPKYVVSQYAGRRRADMGKHRSCIPGDEAVAGIWELHEAAGGDLVVMGSPTLVRTLLGEGLVDELRLMIEPVLLGGGKTIFPDDGALRTLELVSTVTSCTGVHVCTYRPVAEG